MAILLDSGTRVIVQGVTGRVGRSFAERLAQDYPQNFAGGVGSRRLPTVAGKPVFGLVAEAVAATGATASVLTVPAPWALDAAVEAIEAGITYLSIYTDGMTVRNTVRLLSLARARGVTVVGPNAGGVVSPGRCSASELSDAGMGLKPGPIGIAAKSGSLCQEVLDMLRDLGLGQSTVCCLGGDQVIGLRFADVLPMFDADPLTRAVILIGELGGRDEYTAGPVIARMSKPVIAYVAGHVAQPDRPMGHAGAILSGQADETAAMKSRELAARGASVAGRLEELPALLLRSLGEVDGAS